MYFEPVSFLDRAKSSNDIYQMFSSKICTFHNTSLKAQFTQIHFLGGTANEHFCKGYLIQTKC